MSISANYSQPRIFDVGEPTSVIKPDLTVIATYDDETEKEVSNYKLSGSLSTDGRNEITVSYKGFSESFNVLAAPANRWVNNVLTIPVSKLEYGSINGSPPTYHGPYQNRANYVGTWVDFDERYEYTVVANTSFTPNVATLGLNKVNVENYAKIAGSGSMVDSTWQSNGYIANSDDLYTDKNIVMLWVALRRSDNSNLNLSDITSITITRALKG